MSRVSRLLPALALTVLATFGLARGASAQQLDDTWFKLAVSSKGFVVDSGTNAVTKASVKTTVYMHLFWDAVNSEYDYDIWSADSGGAYSITYQDSLGSSLGANEALFTDVFLSAELPNGDFVEGYITARTTIKLDKDGVTVKSASFTSLGGEAIDDSTVGGNDFRGDLKASGKLIAVAKLPFVPM